MNKVVVVVLTLVLLGMIGILGPGPTDDQCSGSMPRIILSPR